MDPLSLHELALELGMTVSELIHGRGTPTPLKEVAVDWPLFNAYRAREQKRQIKEAESRGQR